MFERIGIGIEQTNTINQAFRQNEFLTGIRFMRIRVLKISDN